MLTIREAMQRLGQYNIKLERFGSLQWRLSYREDSNHDNSRLVDDLDDAVIVAADMRFQRTQFEPPKAASVRYVNRRVARHQFVMRQLARLEVLRAI